jgi:dTDP-4-amino-4,6-dideoxygalactose transaminase
MDQEMKNRPRLFLSPPHMGGDELGFVREAFASNYIAPLGPMVDAFEREFCEKVQIPYAVAVSSGTAAMHLALRCLGVGPGDEVMASTLTFIGSVTPILFEGATPVFIDCDLESWNMDPALLKQELDRRARHGRLPKAVVPTDLYGQCCDYSRILSICARHGVPVVTDAAEALGAFYLGAEDKSMALNFELQSKSKPSMMHQTDCAIHNPRPEKDTTTKTPRHAGMGAKAAVFSFNGNKIITTSGGGMMASDNEEFVEKARFLSQQARDPAPHYEHSQIGYNYRMSNIVAAIGRGQLRVLDERVAQKRRIFEYYREALGDLPGIEFMPEAPYGRCNRWLTVILVTAEEFGRDREAVRLALEAENIESRPLWKPMHLQPVFHVTEQNTETPNGPNQTPCHANGRHRARAIGGAVSEDLFKRGLCLPSGTQMSEEDLERVAQIIRRLHNRR